ncbi:precorrin-6A synthase (deacetylating) [Roseovarius atlanticus]|uniref:precorrin-6A synthase (deacetylating) n=1 Tax=Roseovarius atlanticus TaxID=1641875 RepID=UPI001C97C6DF|nr:precorrin-6A synthase (deacetylating) [Roseovarius atlanticus]MBY5989915.1 precorrin-6A synthase (deacetylating) [Roseovarius atlanticus]MBY6126460.1 precorrin-6A synthase (deacetylating) [Roseovarius atlanticus]MBY6150954.1 precorrin-6A synthase (deacetylating) [Roseovarius atlanticus]
MIENLWLIGIGTGNPAHVTLEGTDALRNAAVILLPTKGDDKEDLAHLRRAIITASGSTARIVPFEYPVRDPDLPYIERVAAWHDEIARRWITALGGQSVDGPVALLVWGDPSLYDSTIRIAECLSPKPAIRVVPGITAIQALTAAHAIPLNTVDGPVRITTGRQLRETGLPENETTAVVMLDGLCSFQQIDPAGLHIWWGAYLGSEKQILIEGALTDVGQKIVDKRSEARAANGWIMDSYLLRRT